MRRAVILMIAPPAFAASFAAMIAATVAVAATQFESANYEVTSGVSSVIGEHARWNELCRALDAPLVILERASLHGSICVRHDLVTSIQTRSGRAANCIGRRLNGVLIVYRPKPGFSGTDTLRYGLEFPEGVVSREISIDIQARSGVMPEFFLDVPMAVPRIGDRIPECAGESS